MNLGQDNMYIRFNKDNISTLLPEIRPKMIFKNPDVFIKFEGDVKFVVWNEILKNINEHWLKDLSMWDTQLDFGSNSDDYSKQFDDYKTIELLQFPVMEAIDVKENSAFIYDQEKNLYISEQFVRDLKSAGCIDVWFNTTAPYGRY
ncbi:hypothetical protein ACPV5O_25930 [Vibrio maritimus]|uniref:hypothetical protein n=1 Tax=Vibrio maritimus TaxID=990268 RepID=UPI0040684824